MANKSSLRIPAIIHYKINSSKLKVTNSGVGRGSSTKYPSCIACSDVIRFVGSMISIFCSWQQKSRTACVNHNLRGSIIISQPYYTSPTHASNMLRRPRERHWNETSVARAVVSPGGKPCCLPLFCASPCTSSNCNSCSCNTERRATLEQRHVMEHLSRIGEEPISANAP